MSAITILEMRLIAKRFPGVQALHGVDLDLKSGEVHVLMGENGAGKSTLMKILAGIHPKDSGEIILEGHAINPVSPRASLLLGIAMIHQELNPIPEMTIAENIFLGREPSLTRLGILNAKRMNSDASEIFRRIGLDFDPKRKMGSLSVAESQMVEIAKAISFASKIIIMDEPTSAITTNEVAKLFEMIRLLKARGVGIIYISHKMDEIFAIADRITVLRDGRLIATKLVKETNNTELISMMVGREISAIYPRVKTTVGGSMLRVEGLSLRGKFNDISFEVRKGEILGIAGLMGAGRTEVVETIFGLRRPTSGSVFVDGMRVTIRQPTDAIRFGIAIVSEDRKGSGLNLKGSVGENLSLPTLRDYCTLGVIRRRSEEAAILRQIDRIRIKTPSSAQLVINLSGGNQQKVVVGKWLMTKPQILIMDEPTRGIDVGAKAEIHALISGIAAGGKAVIMISSELPEIVGMSDRVFVMHEGEGMGYLNGDDISQERIIALATGHERGASA